MSNSSGSSGSGIGVEGLLGVAFVVLKLLGYINWSWWYVTMPFWGGFALYVIGLAVVVIGIGGVLSIKALISARRRAPSRCL